MNAYINLSYVRRNLFELSSPVSSNATDGLEDVVAIRDARRQPAVPPMETRNQYRVPKVGVSHLPPTIIKSYVSAMAKDNDADSGSPFQNSK